MEQKKETAKEYKLKFYIGEEDGSFVARNIKIPKIIFNPFLEDFDSIGKIDFDKAPDKEFIDVLINPLSKDDYKVSKIIYPIVIDPKIKDTMNYFVKKPGDPWTNEALGTGDVKATAELVKI